MKIVCLNQEKITLNMKIASINWHDSKNNSSLPKLAVFFTNGCGQIMKDETDERNKNKNKYLNIYT